MGLTVIALPGARGIFIQIKEALCHVTDKRINLTIDVHNVLTDF